MNTPNQGNQGNRNNNNRSRPNGNRNNNRRRYKGNFNKNKPQNPSSNSDRLVEKYINLLDQHLIARRKYHDLYYRAEPAQLAKLERNFYQTLNDVRDFESRQTPEMREIFEKRMNGLKPDVTYSSNHNLDPNLKVDEEQITIDDPHLLVSQTKTDYSNDTEESVGSMEDYVKYKAL